MNLEDDLRSDLPRLYDDTPKGPDLETVLVHGRGRRKRRQLVTSGLSVAAVVTIAVTSTVAVRSLSDDGGDPAAADIGRVVAAPPDGRGSGDGVEDFVSTSSVDEDMQRAINAALPAGIRGGYDDVYPSDWSRRTPLPDAEAPNATDWYAYYALARGETLRVSMGIDVPYEEDTGNPCGPPGAAGDPRCTYEQLPDGGALLVTEYELSGENTWVLLASMTGADGSVTTASDMVQADGLSRARELWTLTADDLTVVAQADALTFPAPVVTPPTQTPDYLD